MMKKCIVWLLSFIFIPNIVGATTWFSCVGDSFCGSNTASFWGTVSIGTQADSPTGNSHVWMWTFKNGTPGGEGIGNVWPASSIPNGTKEMWIQWRWKYSPGFQWHGVGNKQMYFQPSNTIGMLFMGENITMTPQGPNNANYDPNVSGNSWYHDTGVWHKYKARFRMNSAGNFDGIYQVWVDDRMISDYSKVYYADNPNGISDVAFAVIWGGMGGVITGTHYLYMADVYIGSTDPVTGINPSQKTPSPPTSLSIQ